MGFSDIVRRIPRTTPEAHRASSLRQGLHHTRNAATKQPESNAKALTLQAEPSCDENSHVLEWLAQPSQHRIPLKK